jgi:WD40 repeat protein/transcriptional regulator with XRE-family HTH domain
MPRHSYREHDYPFGQAMFGLRSRIGLTQAGLADLLGVSRRAIGEWEGGLTYPKAEHLEHFLELGVQQHVFAPEREEEEIRALWKMAHQRVLIDEAWLSALLTRSSAAPTPLAATLRMDWVGALDVSNFTGREGELAELIQWVAQERCRLVAILGMGGIGKSALISLLGKQLAPQFDAVLWRSVRDAPSCEELVADCFTFFSGTPPAAFPPLLESRINQLIRRLHERRCLLVLDNLETLLEEGDPEGSYREGYQGYGRLLERLGEAVHRSCVVLTSREKPREIETAEGLGGPVRSLRLSGLSQEAARSLLQDKDLRGDSSAWLHLIASYAGNPLALKIVGQAIVDLFDGDIVPFMHSGEVIFNGIRVVLRQQVARLTPLEQTLLTWLAVVREWTSIESLLSLLVTRPTRARVLEALEVLWRRSLIERGAGATFTLQSVVMEYLTDAMLEQLSEEISTMALDHLRHYALEQGPAKDYVRRTQVRLLVHPLLERLRAGFASDERVEEQLLALLAKFRSEDAAIQGYGPANIISLLKALRGQLRGLDLSRLAIRGAYLQGIEMQDTTLFGATLLDSVFTESFNAVTAVATSLSGQDWAAANWRGEVRVWAEAGQVLHLIWQAHIDCVLALAFSPDGRTLASVSWDNMIKLWNVESGMLLWEGWHTSAVSAVAWSPDGKFIASASYDTTVRLWTATQGRQYAVYREHTGPVFELAWSPDGRLLASGGFDGGIWVWEPQEEKPGIRMQILLTGHTQWVTGLAFSPNGSQLASSSLDGTIKLWDMQSFGCLQTISQQTDLPIRLAWSPDGRTLASAGRGQTIRLWDATQGRSQAILLGHSAAIYNLAYTPDSRTLLSGSDDGTLRVWDVDSGQCLRIIGGYAASLFDIDWSPDSRQLVSCGADTLVTIWDVADVPTPRLLRGHSWIVQGVAWSPDGHLLASSGWDNAIRLWDTATGVCLQVLQGSDAIFQGVAWSPDGHLLASGSYQQGVLVWELTASIPLWIGQTQQLARIRRVVWSPDGTRVVGGSDDGSVYVWDASDGTLLRRLQGHHGAVRGVAWSPDGRWLVSSSGGEGGELFVWEAGSLERARTLVGHPGAASAVAWSPGEEILISGGSDGILRWWEVQSGACVLVQEAHQGIVQALKVSPDGSMLASCGDDGAIMLWGLQSGKPLQTLRRDRPYERLDITGIQGLTEAQIATLRALGAVDAEHGTPQ